MNSSNFDIDKAFDLLKSSFSIPDEYKEEVAKAVVKYSTKNLSIETATKLVNKEQNLFDNLGVLSSHQNNFNGFTAEWIACMEYNGLKNKGDLLLTIVNPDPQSKADLLHIIKTSSGIIVKPGPDVKSGSEDYIINEYERNLKEKYDIPFLDTSGTLTTEDGFKRLSPRKKARVNKMFEDYPNKRPIPSSIDNQAARKILKKMIKEYNENLDLTNDKLDKEKVEQVKNYFKQMVKKNGVKSWADFASESKSVFSSNDNTSKSEIDLTQAKNQSDTKKINNTLKNEDSRNEKEQNKSINDKLKKPQNRKSSSKVIDKAANAIKYIEKHPRIKEVVITLGEVIITAALTKTMKTNRKDSDYNSEIKNSINDIELKQNPTDRHAEKDERVTRSTSKEHIVPSHKQRYKTKNGTIIKEKAPYNRGGKND